MVIEQLRQQLMRPTAAGADLAARAQIGARCAAQPAAAAGWPMLTEDELLAACDDALDADRSCVLLLCDIDQMAEINEAWGTSVGNRVIESVRRRLLEFRGLAASALIAQRYGGAYLVMFESDDDERTALPNLAREMATALSLPMLIDGCTVGANVSVGLALGPEHGAQASALLQHALMAVKRAKRSGGARAVCFDPRHAGQLRERDTRMAAMRLAMDRGDFRVAYQPIVDIGGQVTGAEALLRCHGLNSPSISGTIQLLEESGLIIDVGLWVLREACRQAALWQTQRTGGFSIHVNLSALQLADRRLADDIDAALRRFELPAHALQLEITESSLVAGGSAVLDNVARLQASGLRFWIDDFGTGYNSLSYLQQLPVSGIKIDRSFVAAGGEHPRGARLLAAMTRLAEQMSLEVIAEGVETEVQARQLHLLGIHAQQGFLYGGAMLAPQFEARFL